MGRPFGELKLSSGLEQLRSDLESYLGALNEIRLGLNVEVPEKPDALIYFEQVEEFNTLPRAGGLLDQPYILMRELKICSEVVSVFRALVARQQAQNRTGAGG